MRLLSLISASSLRSCQVCPLFTELPGETVRKGCEQRSKRGFGRYTEQKWPEEPLFGGSLGYSGSASETFRTVSEKVFSETRSIEGSNLPHKHSRW